MLFFMADPPVRRSTPEYHVWIAIREYPSLEVVAIQHYEVATVQAQILNHFVEEGVICQTKSN